MADVAILDAAILHVPGQPEGCPDGETMPGMGIRWTPPDPDLLDRVLVALQRL